MREPHFFHKYQQKLKQIPRRVWIFGGVGFLLVLYGVLFFIPKSVAFSYAGKTCASQVMLLPDIQRPSQSDALAVSLEGGGSIGAWRLFSSSVCFSPQKSFSSGEHTVSVSPWGGIAFATQFRVEVPEAPQLVNVSEFTKRVSASRPIEMHLSTADVLYAYQLKATDRTARCEQENDAVILSCDTVSLQLEHGKGYTFALYRDIPGVTETQKVATFEATTLTPVAITGASVSNEQTIYDVVNTIEFTTDKPLQSAKATVYRKDGETEVAVSSEMTTEDAKGTLSFAQPLARKATYLLRVSELNGTDGSSLAAPYEVTFATSGGPKVSASSAGANSLSRSQTVTLTFDQPIDDSVNVNTFIRVEGASATVVKRTPTEVNVTLQNAPLCAPLTITVDKGIKSGSNGEVSDEAWSQQTRVICGTSGVIGYSVRGRPIVAYYFGSGASTILFTGGMHGSEPSGYSTMLAWANYLMAYGNQIPAGKRVVIVPNTNPDGIAAGTRYSSTNVNIGRNFPTANWKADIETTSGVLQNGGGTGPGSEPETAALMALTRQLRPRLEVSFHAQGSLVGANKYSDSVAIGNVYAATVGYGTMFYDAEAVMGYPMTGEYEDWMGEEMGIPAILIELPTSSGNYLNSQLAALKKMLTL